MLCARSFSINLTCNFLLRHYHHKSNLLDNSPPKEYDVFVMNTVKVYEEVIDFIAAGTTPQNVIAFRPSEAAQERVTDLLSRIFLRHLPNGRYWQALPGDGRWEY